MNVRRLFLVLSVSAASVSAVSAPASALCAAPPGGAFNIDEASFVFVGTVDSADDTGRTANVVVESVWKGQVDEHVQVQGGPANPQIFMSNQRTYDVGTRYLFMPFKGNGEVFEDNGCSDTQEWRPKLARHAPEGAAVFDRSPPTLDPQAAQAADEGDLVDTPAGQPPARNGRWLWTAIAVALALVLAVLVQRQRGRAG